uniref:(northern house mosquito) hypothetical protein n=4 Tax=Culex pipiens TaxID=7175 RepID=A0A8D8CBY3_CULPI
MSKSKVTVYFFTNGQPFKPPHKVTIPRHKLEENQIVERINRLHYYNGYVVYTLFGEVLRSVQEIHDESAFVAVPRDQCFQPGPYAKVFRDYANTKLPVIEESKKGKKKKASTKPLGTSYGCKAPTPRMAKEVRFCPGCRHVAVDTRCKHFGAKRTRNKQDACQCRTTDPHGECVPKPVRPPRKVRRERPGWSCCRRKPKKKEYVVKLRKRDVERLEGLEAAKKDRPKSAGKRTGCCGKRPTREEHYRKMREKMVKQRKQRLQKEQHRRNKELKEAQNRIKSRRRRQRCMARCCPCCVKKPEPIWRQPPPHNCVEHLRKAREYAIRRRRALQIPEQTSWESVTFPPKFRKKIRGTQVTKEDIKKAKKASGGGWNCFRRKKKTVQFDEEEPPCSS